MATARAGAADHFGDLTCDAPHGAPGIGGLVRNRTATSLIRAPSPLESVHAERENRAVGLHERLDFRPVGEQGVVYWRLEGIPSAAFPRHD